MKILTMTMMSLILMPAALQAGGYRSMAKEFSNAAEDEDIERLAVLPFSPLDASSKVQGRIIAARLTTDISRRGKVYLVERGRLDGVLGEQQLRATGAMDSQSLSELGRLLQAQAVVVGSYVTIGEKLEVHARLVDVESGMVLASRSARVRKEPVSGGIEDFFRSLPERARVWKPARRPRRGLPMARALRRGVSRARRGYRDALSSTGCTDADRRIDGLEESVLELKARYWARQVREHGLSVDSVAARLGSRMTDPSLRVRFRRSLETAVDRDAPALDEEELRRFKEADGQAFQLHMSCRLTTRRR